MPLSRGRSVELLRPTFNHPSRVGSAAAASFNLVSTIIGGGSLSLPYAFDLAGIVGGPLLLLAVGITSAFTMYVLVSASRRSGAATFEDVMAFALGEKARVMSMVLVIFLTYLATLAYMILLRDLTTPIAQAYITGEMTLWQSNALLALLIVLVMPLCLLTNLNSLRFLSIFSICSILVLATGVVVRSVECQAEGDGGSVKYGPESIVDVLQAIPIMVATYVCHFNILPVHGELERPTRKRLMNVVNGTIAICSVLYLVISIFGYLYGSCHSGVEPNILQNFGNRDVLMNLGRAGLSCTIFGSFPLLVSPCRDMLIRLYETYIEHKAVEGHRNSLVEPGEHLIIGHDVDHATERRDKIVETLGDDDEDTNANGNATADDSSVDDDTTTIVATNGDGVSLGLDHNGANGLTEMPTPVVNPTSRYANGHGGDDLEEPLVGYGADRLDSRASMKSDGTAIAPPDRSYRALLTTVAVMASCFFISSFIDDVAIVWGLVGSSVSIMIAFVLPSWAYLNVRKHKPYYHRLKVTCRIILAISPILALVCTGTVIWAIVTGG